MEILDILFDNFLFKMYYDENSMKKDLSNKDLENIKYVLLKYCHCSNSYVNMYKYKNTPIHKEVLFSTTLIDFKYPTQYVNEHNKPHTCTGFITEDSSNYRNFKDSNPEKAKRILTFKDLAKIINFLKNNNVKI